MAPPPVASTLPLIGRAAELAMLTSVLDDAEQRHGSTVFVSGEAGVGKTRLLRALTERAERRGWTAAVGQVHPVESGVPYAAFADALVPVIRAIGDKELVELTRGGAAELACLLPSLAITTDARLSARENPAEFKSRLLWNFAQFIGRLAEKRPVLLVLENLQWIDASSLELLHFLARQVGQQRVAIVVSYNDAERDRSPALRTAEQSLVALGVARSTRLGTLSLAETEDLVFSTFGEPREETRAFCALLYGWTRGNAFFMLEAIKSLVESGSIRREGTRWTGWDVSAIALPASVRDSVMARLARLSPPARALADLAAVVGTRASYDVLRVVSGVPEEDLLLALDELRQQRVLVENADAEAVIYDFGHPSVQQTLYEELGVARTRALHATVAEALERFHGPNAVRQADELAAHFARGDSRNAGPKAVTYLLAAGRQASARYANREADDYLTAALDRLDRLVASNHPEAADVLAAERPGVVAEELAQVRQRLGEYENAMGLWRRARTDALEANDPRRLASVERRMGLARYWSGRYTEALQHYADALIAARAANDEMLVARILLSRGASLQALGRPGEALVAVREALVIAERLGDVPLLARVHRTLLLLHVWTGPMDTARVHASRAVELSEATGHRGLAWTAHWGAAVLAGLTSSTEDLVRHLGEAERLAEELRSPLLRLWTAEVAIEYASGIGEWDTAIALGERSIATARALGQRTLLPRLLFWTGLIYLNRGETERAKSYFDEAWETSGAGGGADRPMDVHTVVPAHTGLVHYWVAMGDHRKAIEIGVRGLEIADRTGYVAWAIYRLLPMVTEAAIWLQDFETARPFGERLHRDSAQLGHQLGIAWSTCYDALVAMLRKEHDQAVDLLTRAAQQLESVPFVYDAARVRRKLAWVLAEIGDKDGAVRELKLAHDVFAKLGADPELTITRSLLRDFGARPPAIHASGVFALSEREKGIVELVVARKSNKEIGVALGISPRTVSTHLSNIFAKLEVTSRGELADLARSSGMTSP